MNREPSCIVVLIQYEEPNHQSLQRNNIQNEVAFPDRSNKGQKFEFKLQASTWLLHFRRDFFSPIEYISCATLLFICIKKAAVKGNCSDLKSLSGLLDVVHIDCSSLDSYGCDVVTGKHGVQTCAFHQTSMALKKALLYVQTSKHWLVFRRGEFVRVMPLYLLR